MVLFIPHSLSFYIPVQYLWKLTGVSYWTAASKLIVRASHGHLENAYIPERGRAKVTAECRAFLAGYAVLAALSLRLGTSVLLWLWVLPAILGQPALRTYLMAEHTGLPLVFNMFSNSRTIFASPPVQWLAWNMPHHAAHHALPVVPFHRLPRLTGIVRQHLTSTASGYLDAHRQIRATLAPSSKGKPQASNHGQDAATE